MDVRAPAVSEGIDLGESENQSERGGGSGRPVKRIPVRCTL